MSTHTTTLVVRKFLPVSAMLVGLARTVTARDVCLGNIKPTRGLLRALPVELGNIPTRQHIYVLIVLQARIRRAEDQSACCVVLTHTLIFLVMRLRPVSAMLALLEKTVTARDVCLGNIKPTRGLLRALIVQLGNFQLPSMYPAIRVQLV